MIQCVYSISTQTAVRLCRGLVQRRCFSLYRMTNHPYVTREGATGNQCVPPATLDQRLTWPPKALYVAVFLLVLSLSSRFLSITLL